MKKKDLCRSIESIKQENELKERILKGVEEKDKITVIRRPLFIPVIAALVCLNVGMAAKLVIFNKSQVNMSELKARTSMSAASDDSDMDGIIEDQKELIEREAELRAELEKRQREQDDLENELRLIEIKNELEQIKKAEEMQNYDTQETVFLRFMTDVNNENCTLLEEWRCSEDFVPNMTTPYYYTIPAESVSPTGTTGEYTVRRYVQTIPFFTPRDDGATTCEIVNTNHEYIVVYKGECELQNMVSITESNIDSSYLLEKDLDEGYENYNNYKDTNADDVYGTMEKVGERYINEMTNRANTNLGNAYFSVLDTFLMYPQTGNNGDAEFVTRCYASLSSSPNSSYDDPYDSYDPLRDADSLRFYFLDDKGNEITDMTMSASSNEDIYTTDMRFDPESYWKDTVYISNEILNERVEIPDVIGMSAEEAEQTLIEAGLDVTGKYYVEDWIAVDDPIEFNHVVNVYPYIGSIVDKGEKIEIGLRGIGIPYLGGEDVDTAEKILRDMGYEVKYEYLDGTKPGDSDLCVLYSDPKGLDVNATEVTLYITERDRTQ